MNHLLMLFKAFHARLAAGNCVKQRKLSSDILEPGLAMAHVSFAHCMFDCELCKDAMSKNKITPSVSSQNNPRLTGLDRI